MKAKTIAAEVIELNAVMAKGTEAAGVLSKRERVGFEECEEIIRKGLSTFYEVGHALLMIQESRLYRPAYSSFKEYCQKRWNIGRAYAYRVLGAAERVKLLPPDEPLPKPTNEFQMRPFLKFEPDVFPPMWKRIVKTAKGGKITTRIVRAVLRELRPNEVEGRKKRRKGKVPVGQCLALVKEARRCMEKGEPDKALSALERIENLLGGA